MSHRVNSQDDTPTLIYCLKDPETNEIRYVGKTVGSLANRLRGHISVARTRAKRGHSVNWIVHLLERGLHPIIELIEIVQPGNDWAERERYWIGYGRASGWRLTNLTDGGEGAPGFSPNDATRHKYSIRATGENNRRAILTESSVLEIRNRYAAGGITCEQLALEYGVKDNTIEACLSGATWKHVAGQIQPKRTTSEQHPSAKLNAADVLEIRRLFAFGIETVKTLAALYQIDKATVLSIVHGETWRDTGGIVVSQRDNTSGENNPRAKLTAADVREIRRLYASGNQSYLSLARRYGVSKIQIGNIIRRDSWIELNED